VLALLYRSTDMILYSNRVILSRGALRTYLAVAVNLGLFSAAYLVSGEIDVAASSYWDLALRGLVVSVIVIPAWFTVVSVVCRHEFLYVWSVMRRVVFKRRLTSG